MRLIEEPDVQGDREEELRELISFAAATGAAIFVSGCSRSEPACIIAPPPRPALMFADRLPSSSDRWD